MTSTSPARATGEVERLASTVLDRCRAAGLTLATAESLTGGLVCAALSAVPGSSAVLRGGVVAYATQVKAAVLHVDPHLLERHGPVDGEVARQMAAGACRALEASVGLATTGVAGPGAHDGVPAGTVHVAAVVGSRTAARALELLGDRDAVRAASVVAVLDLAAQLLAGVARSPVRPGS